MTRCNKCNSYVADHMAFCTNCGEPLEFETVIRPPVTTASYEYTEIPKDHTVLKITGIIGGLLIFGSVLYLAGRFTATTAVQPAMNANAANQVVASITTPPPTPRTPEPTPTVAKTPKPRRTPVEIDPPAENYLPANANRANPNAPPQYNAMPNVPTVYVDGRIYRKYDETGREIRAVCKSGTPSYWQMDRWATCLTQGGVKHWFRY